MSDIITPGEAANRLALSISKGMSECVCGGSTERPNDDCERCQLVARIGRLEALVALFLFDGWEGYQMSPDDYLRHLRILKTGRPEHKNALVAVREFTKKPISPENTP